MEGFGIILTVLSVSIVIILSYKYKTNFSVWCAVTYLTTMLLEIIGTNTGLVFGEYSYGNNLSMKILGVPVTIGLLWIIVILGSVSVANRLNLKPYWSGLFLILFDIPLEMIATNRGFWHFNEGVSIMNFLVWGVIGVLFSYYLYGLKIKFASKTGSALFIGQGIVFAFLAFFKSTPHI
jgi:putative membrane protein